MSRSPLDVEQLKREVAAHRWFHTIDLGDGVVTPGDDDSPAKLRTLGLPDRLDGLSVLDVGAWDGFFSFEAERRGAARVLATDDFCWSGPGWGSKAGFDLVFFLGVLYHMQHPLLALERIASVTRRQLILETGTDMTWFRKPLLAYYPFAEAVGDDTNWCGPNPAAVIAMLRTVGFKEVKVHHRLAPVRALARSARQTLQRRRLFLISRFVFHAWK